MPDVTVVQVARVRNGHQRDGYGVMDWVSAALDFLESRVGPGYSSSSAGATEPTALAALALASHGRIDVARRQLQVLSSWQATDGSLGVTTTEAQPQWPTTLAVVAWTKARSQGTLYQQQIDNALGWLLQQEGETIPPRGDNIGHDTMLVGWPWVAGTHSWLEPTAFALLALKAADRRQHPRAREAAKLLSDRLLPEGGCNYGNTYVLGQQLRPHVQPTGLVMLALAGEQLTDPRMAASCDFLNRELTRQRSAASFAYAVMGLAAQNVKETAPAGLIAGQFAELAERALADQASLRLALLLLAAQAERSLLNPQAPAIAVKSPTSKEHVNQ